MQTSDVRTPNQAVLSAPLLLHVFRETMHALACWPQTCLKALGPQGLAAFDDRQASGRGTPAVGKAPALLNGSLLMPTPDVCSISMLCFFVAYPTLADGEDAWSSETTIIVSTSTAE